MKDILGENFLEIDKEEKFTGGLPGYEELSPQEQNEKLQEIFREVFGTENGKIVLTVILEDLYYFAPCVSDEAKALNNYAKTLLASRLKVNKSKDMVDALLSI